MKIIRSRKTHQAIFDLVSVGTKNRPDYQLAQQKTFASHPLVRHFFQIAEDDDTDQGCNRHLTKQGAYQISSYCRSKSRAKEQFVLQHLRSHYARDTWLSKKSNPVGWICAHRRPVHGFAKAIQRYRDTKEPLPDYLVIMDDDTYYNIDLVSAFLKQTVTDQRLPVSIAGCLVRHPIYQINFTFPFGGWGLIYNKAALANFMRPIRCLKPKKGDAFMEGSCNALMNNAIGELEVFKGGMSISDLMQAYASWQPYSQFRNWTTGYCLHADWLFGYFTNFYPVSIHVPDPFYKHVPHARLIGYNGSEIYGRKDIERRKQCDNAYENCTVQSHICHYQNPLMMERLFAGDHLSERVASNTSVG